MSVPAPRLTRTLVIALLATAVAACGTEPDGAVSAGRSPGPTDGDGAVSAGRSLGPTDDASAEAGARAQRDAEGAADRWEADRAADKPRPFLVRGGLPVQLGDWEPNNHAFKVSLGDGCFAPPASGVLPPTPVDGEVRWADGVVRRRPATAPLQGYGKSVPPELRSRCGTAESPRLTVTSVSATTRTVQTTEGPATVPAWELAFANTSVRVIGPAVADDPWPAAGRPIDGAETATVGPDGRSVTVGFSGAPDEPGPCGSDYRAVLVQRDRVVVVAVVGSRKAGPTVDDDGRRIACSLVAATRTLAISLDAPLGDRALIGTGGLPLRPPPTRPAG